MNYNVYVISAGRYDKLSFTPEQKSKYRFCVKKGEKHLYEKHGCKNVFETGTLMQSRNAALDMAFNENKICVQLSDDLKKVTTNKNFAPKKQVDIDFAIDQLVNVFKKVDGVYLMGIPPTSNDFFAKSLISKNTFCIGDMLFVKPMKRVDLIKVEHNVKIGDKCEYIEPNVTEDSIFYADGEPIGFYLTKMPEKMCKLADLANKEFRSKNVPKSLMARAGKKENCN
jgi:hypothetical protein